MVTNELPTWPRPHFTPGGGDVHLFYKVFGSFAEAPRLSRSKYRCSGIPESLGPYEQRPDQHPEAFFFGMDGVFLDRLREKGNELLEAVRTAPQCLVLQGTLDDPGDLNYFRDVIGVITAFLDAGGVAVFDPLILDWWTAEEWRTQIFGAEQFSPLRHVSLMRSDDEQSAHEWFHTRGMLKFGRPDLSIRGVTPELVPGVQDLMQRFVNMLALGGVVPEGQEVRMASLPDGWRCFHEGVLDDPDFNNVHLYIGPPRLRHLTLDLQGIELAPLLAAWKWLLTEPLQPFAMSYFGDWFLTRENGVVVMLDTVAGEVHELAPSRSSFESGLEDPENADDWFMPDLAFASFRAGLKLEPGKCLSWKVPPVLSGELAVDNLEVTDLAVHQHISAQIHQQTKDMPDGATIKLVKKT